MNYAPLILFASLLFLTTPSHAQSTERVSLGTSGGEGNDDSSVQTMSLSADGRFVAFQSFATNLVPADLNHSADIFVRDLELNTLTRVSLGQFGNEGNAHSDAPSISANGRYVAFHSFSNNLVEGDTNNQDDVFVRDRLLGKTVCISRSMHGSTGNGRSWNPVISADGRHVAFVSRADDLVEGDSNWNGDIFVYDILAGEMTRVSVSSSGEQSNSFSEMPSISANGRMVAFCSFATNLVTDDTNGQKDVFVHDRVSGETSRVSVSSSGGETTGLNTQPCISADGNLIAFTAHSDELDSNDTNKVSDIYLHDLRNLETVRVSLDSGGTQAKQACSNPALSADGQMIAFQTANSNWGGGDTNGVQDIYLHHRGSAAVERISIGPLGVEPDMACLRATISANGGMVAYHTRSDAMLDEDENGKQDVYLRRRNRVADWNHIILSGPLTALVGEQVRVSWAGCIPETKYWLLGSRNLNGAIVYGHSLDLGFNLHTMAEGANRESGSGWAVSAPIPSAVAGWTYYLELIAQNGQGGYLDSIVHTIEIHP